MRRVFLTLAACGCLAGACSSDSSWRSSDRDTAPALSVSTSNTAPAVGDTTSFTVKSRNTLGRNAHVEWTTTGGKITTEDNGRIARASFDAPGAYTITATLYVDNTEAARDSVTVHVKSIR